MQSLVEQFAINAELNMENNTPTNNKEKKDYRCSYCVEQGYKSCTVCEDAVDGYANKLLHDIVKNQESMNNQKPFLPQDIEKGLDIRKELTLYLPAVLKDFEWENIEKAVNRLITQTKEELMKEILEVIEIQRIHGDNSRNWEYVNACEDIDERVREFAKVKGIEKQ